MLYSIPRNATVDDANYGRNGFVAATHGDDTTIMNTATAVAIGAAVGMVERDRGTESMLAVLGISHSVTQSENGDHETHTWTVPAGISPETLQDLSSVPNGMHCQHGYDCGQWYAEPVRIERGTYPIDAHDTVTQEWYINA